MKVLFLDVDGVINCQFTAARSGHALGIDPYMALLVVRIIDATKCKVILSSSWRYDESAMAEVRKMFIPIDGITPKMNGKTSRGTEIRMWLEANQPVERYAILDDNDDMLKEQMPNFFKCAWDSGITEELSRAVIKHLNETV